MINLQIFAILERKSKKQWWAILSINKAKSKRQPSSSSSSANIILTNISHLNFKLMTYLYAPTLHLFHSCIQNKTNRWMCVFFCAFIQYWNHSFPSLKLMNLLLHFESGENSDIFFFSRCLYIAFLLLRVSRFQRFRNGNIIQINFCHVLHWTTTTAS